MRKCWCEARERFRAAVLQCGRRPTETRRFDAVSSEAQAAIPSSAPRPRKSHGGRPGELTRRLPFGREPAFGGRSAETTRPPRSSPVRQSRVHCPDGRVRDLDRLCINLVSTQKGADGFSSPCRPAVRLSRARRRRWYRRCVFLLTPHRIDAFGRTGHTANSRPKIAHELAPASASHPNRAHQEAPPVVRFLNSGLIATSPGSHFIASQTTITQPSQTKKNQSN